MGSAEVPDPEELLEAARAGNVAALGDLLELYRNYLDLLARLQIGRRLQGKVDAADVVQEVFLKAHAAFGQCRGCTEVELLAWLRQVLARLLVDLMRRYYGARGRDVRLERDLAAELDRSSRFLDRALLAGQTSPSVRAVRLHGRVGPAAAKSGTIRIGTSGPCANATSVYDTLGNRGQLRWT